MLHTPTPTEDRLPSLNQPHPPCTRPQIFNQRPFPVDYDQSSSLLLLGGPTAAAPLNKCPPPQITSTTRQTEQVDERSKEINPLHPKSHPTNLPTLQSAYSNRPPRRKRSKRSSSRRMPETALLLLLQCPHTYTVVNHPQSTRAGHQHNTTTTNKTAS